MTEKMTALVINETEHILAVYSTKSDDEQQNERQLIEERFRNDLALRFVPRNVSDQREVKTNSELKDTDSTVEVKSSEPLQILSGDIYGIDHGGSISKFRVTSFQITSNAAPFNATLSIEWIVKPTGNIPIDQLLLPISTIRRSPSQRSFKFNVREFEAVELEPTDLPVFSRPHQFSMDSGKPVSTPGIDGAKSIKFETTLTSVKVTINFPAKQSIKQETPMACALVSEDKQHVVGRGVINSPAPIPENEHGVEGTIPFAAIPDGENLFLFLVKGLPPIWDKLKANEQHTWILQ